jgi:hypothetical protein
MPDNPQPQLVEEHRSATGVALIALAPVAVVTKGALEEVGRQGAQKIVAALSSKPPEQAE